MFIRIKNLTVREISLPGPLPRLSKDDDVTVDIKPEDYDLFKEELGILVNQNLIRVIVEAGGSYSGNFVFDDQGGRILHKGTQIAPDPPSASDRVRVTAADTVPGFLDETIVAGTGLSRTILNPGADEKYRLDVISLPPHNTLHEDGGSDEIDVTGLSGELADPQPPKLHAGSHLPSGGDPIATATPVNVTKSANAPGTAESLSRSDHKHDISTAAPAATGVGTTSGEGTATSLARADHVHQSNTAPVNVTKAAAVIGTSGEPARADHKHDVSTAAPAQGIGGSNAEGTATTLARSDHDHTIRETSGPTDLAVAGITDGYSVRRVGTTLAGVNPFDPDRTIVVAKDAVGADATNIADAITAAAALTPAPDAANPATILVFPGVYSTAPFSTPAYVSIVGIDHQDSIILEASTTTAALVTMLANSSLSRIILRGANGAGGIGVTQTVAGTSKLNHVLIDDCEKGIYVNGANSVLAPNDVTIFGCDTGLEVGASGGMVKGDLRIENDDAAAIHLNLSAAAVVMLSHAIFRDDKVIRAAGATLFALECSPTPQEESLRVLAELQVGSPEDPKEAIFGEGDSHTRGMVGKTNTNGEVGTWATLNNIYLEDATSDTLFPGVGIDNCFYIGGDLPFPGIKVLITTAKAGGVVVAEYWNGTAWTSVAHMSTDSNAPYNQYAQAVFERVNSEHIRLAPITGWTTKTLDGVNKYWLRYRITTAITTAPAADKIKLHTNRTEINKDGVIEHFGAAIVKRSLVAHYNLANEATDKGGNQDLLFATTITAKYTENRYEDGQARNRALIIDAVEGIDTTRGVDVEIVWTPLSDEIASDVEWEVAFKLVSVGTDLLDGVAAEDGRFSSITTVPANSRWGTFRTKVTVPLVDAVPNDMLAMLIVRDASGANLDDTFPGNIALASLRVSGWFWKGA
jgi:hypothetical protein